ncbi:hypothetical protein COY28_07120 [Candidatus Woesearchaeota archaeon CG_4_10_14_0_2_um_filter_57_5]|nr:MAG: hypothetical protein COY28_07120 [Candidatus Woesearchaeota archaeon CG_4_10_14_0_2_um_filter_57_5]
MHADVFAVGTRMSNPWYEEDYLPKLAQKTSALGLDVALTLVESEQFLKPGYGKESLPQGAIMLVHGDAFSDYVGARRAWHLHNDRPDLTMVVTLEPHNPLRGIDEDSDFGGDIAAALERGLDPSHWLSAYLDSINTFMVLEEGGLLRGELLPYLTAWRDMHA